MLRHTTGALGLSRVVANVDEPNVAPTGGEFVHGRPLLNFELRP